MTRAARWRRFYLVGVIGFVFQLAVLFVLAHWTRLAPSLAVALAVIITVSHNFLWHERVTWPDRPVAGRLRRWVAFQLSTGIISVATGVGLTVSLTRITGLPVVAANAIAVGMASVATFLVSDLLVYRSPAMRRRRKWSTTTSLPTAGRARSQVRLEDRTSPSSWPDRWPRRKAPTTCCRKCA